MDDTTNHQDERGVIAKQNSTVAFNLGDDTTSVTPSKTDLGVKLNREDKINQISTQDHIIIDAGQDIEEMPNATQSKQTRIFLTSNLSINEQPYPCASTSVGSLSTSSTQAIIQTPKKRKDIEYREWIKFWDRWLKVYVITGAIISVAAVVGVLVAESRKVIQE